MVCDLDGTLLQSDGAISPTSVNALDSARAAGVRVICATARTPRAVRRIAGNEKFDVIVCANGAVIWNATTDDIVAEECFDGIALQERIRTVRAANTELAFAVLSSRRMFVESRYLGDRPPRDRELVDDICEVVSGLDVVSVAVRYPNREVEAFIGSVETAFDGVGNVSRGSAVTVDIAPFGVTKATAVAQLVMASGQRPEHTVVFGDMPSDLPLFAWAGYGIAVANAAQVVKAAAAEITASNDRDGVAHAIAGLLGLPHE